MITGYVIDDTFQVEHVIVFNGAASHALTAMLRDGIEEAWALGCRRIAWYVPHCLDVASGLTALGRRLGFKEQHRDDDMAYFVRER